MLLPNGIPYNHLSGIFFVLRNIFNQKMQSSLFIVDFHFTDFRSGLTDENYTEFNQLYQKYKDKGMDSELMLFFHACHFNNH